MPGRVYLTDQGIEFLRQRRGDVPGLLRVFLEDQDVALCQSIVPQKGTQGSIPPIRHSAVSALFGITCFLKTRLINPRAATNSLGTW
jgi:hypothetical protein